MFIPDEWTIENDVDKKTKQQNQKKVLKYHLSKIFP